MQTRSTSLRMLVIGAMLGPVLGACQTNTVAMNAPPGMPVALESIEGAPDTVKTELTSALATAAAARKIELVPSQDARYRIKGYVTAYDRQDGHTEIAYVWDVFDGDKRRAKRIEGVSPVRTAAGGNAWTALDQATIAGVATASMNQVAGFLASDAQTSTAAQPGTTSTSVAATTSVTTSGTSTSALGFADE
ncbi:hypothetical protein ACFQU1_07245 [Chelatococcus sp. GCM10030263]|uniref:hypothetical protein n=1 Tax=Chelatococcus sp. GCM10030263 TaxID=3273387 RepID=UPI00360FCF4E